MDLDIEFFLALGKVFSLVIAMVFMEGIIASRPNAKWLGIILPIFMTVLSLAVFAIWKEWVYFAMVFGPALLCWFIYYVCRRSIQNGTNLTIAEDTAMEEESL